MNDRKKIGLLTFHRTTNFGSCLQTYGLYKKISDLGYECEVIDYRCPAIEKREQLQSNKLSFHPKNLAKQILLQPAINKKAKELFNFSYKHMKVSRPYFPDDIDKSEEEYDKFFVGSDIVWGIDITNNDFTYFLDFVSDQSKKYAFSSSVGSYTETEQDSKISNLLGDFSQIAVRENEAVAWIKRLSQMDSTWVCDPTMLLTKDEWLSLLPIYSVKKKYVLVYFADDTGKCVSDAIHYAKKHNLAVWMINYSLPAKGTKTVKPSSLNDFLSLIYNAETIFTASYHGMLFSIYFEKNFYFYTRAHSTRVLSLASRLKIENRCGTWLKEISDEPINYTVVNSLVKDFRDQSISVLKGMLGE